MEKQIKTIGVLTSGGDAPGMNAAVRAVVRTGLHKGFRMIGIQRGYNGLLNGECFEMNLRSVSNIIQAGGTILYTARCLEFKTKEGQDKGAAKCRELGIDALVVIGGDGSYRGARELAHRGIPMIGLPGTIDNDIACTEYTIGFDTAVNTAMEAIDKVRDTSTSHERCSIIEVMGRDAGWITLYAGLAGNAGVCLIPEIPFTIENIAKAIKKRDEMGLPYTVVAVAEGAKYADGTKVIGKIVEDSPDPVRYSGLAAKVADDLEKVIPNHEVRSVNPGHIIRGGDITAYDRILSIRYGVAAVELINEGKFGNVVTINGDKMGYTSLEEVIGAAKIGQQKHVDPNGELVKAAKAIGISFGDE